MRPIGVVGIPGADSTEGLAAAFRARGTDAVVLPAEKLAHDVAAGAVRCGAVDLQDLSGVAVKKLGDASSPLAVVRATILRAAADDGLPVFSAPESIALAVDRCTMTQRLGAAGIPLPETLVTEDPEAAAAFVRRVGRALQKPRFTSKGRGMRVVEDGPDLARTLDEIAADGLPFYLQRFLADVERDIGVAICDGQVIGAYYRVRGGHAWSTTTRDGGRYEPCPVDPQLERLSLRANSVFGLTFTTVDVVRHDGRSWVYEVSAFGGFHGLTVCGVDAAGRFADAVLARVAPIEARR
jgi:ribosomal protein S6--L-glutamate ligase